jgi:hypothetical protein
MTWRRRLLAELAATDEDATTILDRYRHEIAALPAADRERLFEQVHDIIDEKTGE